MLTYSSNKRIAKNTLYLYLRLLISLILNLYISRILLRTLGVDDFGIYNIVGGIVILMLFVNSTMHNASLRFINISIGGGDVEDVRRTISTSIQIHILLAFIFLLIGETVGLWYVSYQLNIPSGSYETVLVLYQLSLLTAIISIIQVPLTSTIMSYEKIDVYAQIEIIHVIVRCIIIFLIPFFSNRLIAYGFLLLIVSIVFFTIYAIYCGNKIREFCIRKIVYKEKIVSMFSFALFNLIGDGTFAVRQQGTNLLINKFFGVGLNAASGVATQAASLISTFTTNTQAAFKPQIIKAYSAKNLGRMKELIARETDILFILLSFIVNIVLTNLDYLMGLWLEVIPIYAVKFCRIIILCNLLTVINQIIATAIHATGKVKTFNCIVGSLNLLCVFFSFVFFCFGFEPEFAYYSYAFILVLKIIGEAFILNRNIPEVTCMYYIGVIRKPLLLLIISYLSVYSCTLLTNGNIERLVLTTVVNIVVVTILTFLLFPYLRNIIVLNLRNIFYK